MPRALGRVCGRVKRWQSGEMILRWMTAAMSEAANGFRRLKGYAGRSDRVFQINELPLLRLR